MFDIFRESVNIHIVLWDRLPKIISFKRNHLLASVRPYIGLFTFYWVAYLVL